MVTAQFNAFCPLEIGDEIRDTTGGVHTVTDIACIHYVRTGKVEFRFELDGTGYYAPIEIQDAPPRIRAIRIWGYPPEKKPAIGTVKENAIHPQATDADRVLRTIENYPLTVEDVVFRMYRNWLANDFCQPIYEEWFAEAVAKGRIPAPGFFADPIIRKAYTAAEWNGPAQGLLNPVQEVEAAEKRVVNGFSTRDREAMEMNGSDFYRNAAQRKREEKLLREVNEDGGQKPGAEKAGQ